MLSFLSLLWLVQLLWVADGASGKIVEGVDRKSDKDDTTIPYVMPSPFSGPDSLSFLSGSCFTSSFDRYEYTVCPFQNVTQRRTSAMKPVLIGLWGEWKTTNSPIHTEKMGAEKRKSKIGDAASAHAVPAVPAVPSVPVAPVDPDAWYYNIMEFPNGRNCGVDGDSIVTVYLQCEHPTFEIVSLESEASCAYAMTFGMPISCGLLKAVRNE